ncbi:MAG: hypothetical protein JNJ83_06315 [Verrucomicrobiaceae bacterium]|nr:hypothetical protein [Verrucomicrobiaceae bacterium]
MKILSKTIAALVTLTLLMASHAKADEWKTPTGGKFIFTTEPGPKPGQVYVLITGGTPAEKGYLRAGSNEEGAPVVTNGNKTDRSVWQLHQNSNGWNFILWGTGENAVSEKSPGVFILLRNKAGGRDNPDQLFQKLK